MHEIECGQSKGLKTEHGLVRKGFGIKETHRITIETIIVLITFADAVLY